MKEKKKISSKILLIIAVGLMLISMCGTALMNANFGGARVTTFNGTLSELAAEIDANNKANNKNIEIKFARNNVFNFSFMMMAPKTATAKNPAPAIICGHGGSNTKELQMPFYIELVRRGFVVITVDRQGSGRTDTGISSAAVSGDGHGMLAAAEYAMSLDFVDENQIGMTGHSSGNQAIENVIHILNVEGSTQRIRAWVVGDMNLALGSITAENLEGMIWMIGEAQSGEFTFDNLLKNDLGKQCIRTVYPAFNAAAVPEDQWFTANGPVATPAAGKALGVDSAVCISYPPLTHPGWHFSLSGTRITIDGFYAAFGTPTNAKFLPSDNQIWPLAVVFGALGMIGFFMLLFPLVDLLLKTKLFAGVKRELPAVETLPSIKKPAEWISLIVMAVACISIGFHTYMYYYPKASRYLNTSVYAGAGVSNGIAIWSLVFGAILILLLCLSYAIKRPLYGKDGSQVASPFAPAGLTSVSQFFRTVLLAFTVVVVMFIPVFFAYYVFNADFRICSFGITAADLDKLYIILVKYLPLWAMFYIPNAIFNAGTRYRDMPEWLSTVICAVVNCAAVVIFLFYQYGTIPTTGYVRSITLGMAGIIGFAVAPVLAFAAFSARYIYKKTGNAWAAGITNALLACCITTFTANFYTDLMFPV